MSVFQEIAEHHHEEVVFCHDSESGLKAIIAIHDTTLGPALGGCRMWAYENEALALKDVLRLSRGMTYKAAAAGLNLGGGKAVIIGNAKLEKTETLFRAYGRFVQSLAGRYITAEDVNTTMKEMEWIRMETDYVCGISRALGGFGDPSLLTALGCYEGIKASLRWQTGSESLEKKTVAVQGVGAVGSALVKHLVQDGANVIVSDIDADNLKRVTHAARGVEVASPSEIHAVDCDVFAPCALGAVLNDDTIPALKCGIVAGSANNQLADEERHAQMLSSRGILYAPDYVINAGGLINVANELEGYDRERAEQQVESIFDIVTSIYRIASDEKVTTHRAANALAERRIARLGRIHRTWTGRQMAKRGRGIL